MICAKHVALSNRIVAHASYEPSFLELIEEKVQPSSPLWAVAHTLNASDAQQRCAKVRAATLVLVHANQTVSERVYEMP